MNRIINIDFLFVSDMKTEQTLPTELVTANSEQLSVLKSNFPQCFDRQGKFILSKLQEILQADGVDVSRESYNLNWLGKSYARVLANEPIRTMLSEDTEHNEQKQNKHAMRTMSLKDIQQNYNFSYLNAPKTFM